MICQITLDSNHFNRFALFLILLNFFVRSDIASLICDGGLLSLELLSAYETLGHRIVTPLWETHSALARLLKLVIIYLLILDVLIRSPLTRLLIFLLLLLEFRLDVVALSVEDLEKFISIFNHFLLILVNKKWAHDHLIKSMKVLHAAFVNTLPLTRSALLLEVRMQFFRPGRLRHGYIITIMTVIFMVCLLIRLLFTQNDHLFRDIYFLLLLLRLHWDLL